MAWAFNLPGALYLGYTQRNSFPCPRRDSWMTPGIWARGGFHVRRRRFSSKLGNPYRNPITDISDLENCPSQPLQPTPKKNLQGRTHDPRIRSLTGRGGELCGQCAGCVRDAELHELVNGRDLATGFSMLSDDVFFLGWCPEIGGIL